MLNPKKLLLVIASLNVGGAERILVELANYWQIKGHKVTILTLLPGSSFYTVHPQVVIVTLSSDPNSWIVKFLALNKLIKVLLRIFKVRKIIKAILPDHIISFMDLTNLTVLLANMNLNIPVLISERTDPAYHKLPKAYNFLRTLLYPLARNIVVQTKAIAAYFPYSLDRQIRIIPNFVLPPAHIKTTNNTVVKKIVAVGRLCPFKGLQLIIEAFATIVKDYPDVVLVIYGEGSYRQKLEELIINYNLLKQVSLPGAIKDLSSKLSEADLFIAASYYEGFPNALAEAMTVGLPVIASTCSGHMEIINDRVNGRLFPVADLKTLINIIIELLKDHRQRIILGTNARRICEEFNTNKIFKLWDELI